MTNKLVMASLLFLSFLSCKKDIPDPVDEPVVINQHYPTKAGSYFVYHWYTLDSNKVETLFNAVDTMYVLGDSMLNGNTYTVYKETFLGSWNRELALRRDSAGYIVDQRGLLLYSYVNFNDTFHSGSIPDIWNFHSKMINRQDKTVVPAGSFSSVECRTYYYNDERSSLTACGDTVVTFGTYYAPLVGEIKMETAYQFVLKHKCETMERRLVTYYIP